LTEPINLFLENEQATLDLGGRLAGGLASGMLVALHGPLGAGKTTLTRGVLRALGFEGRVKSPTYALVELYKLSRLDLYHFDFYRFSNPQELIESGLQEAESLLPTADVDISLTITDGARSALLTAQTEKGRRCLQQLKT
jgi:tRNA threonylcarbamoyladenosine biosynthesis protein TsaE